MTSDIYHY